MPHRSQKVKYKNQDGFVAIIALAIFAVMMFYAISLQMTTMDTLENIRSWNNYRKAEIIADSMMGHLQRKAKDYEVGWNTGEVICGFGKYKDQTTVVEGGGQSEICQYEGLLAMVAPNNPGDAQKDIKVTMRIKGHAEDSEKIKTMKCGSFNNNCYVVPSPGTGDAGNKTYCQIYDPVFLPSLSGDKVPANLANGSNQLDQVNYSCNWNKLQLGSSAIDRVAVPLYYDSAKIGEASTIVNSFHKNTAPPLKASNILVRLRTPCVPCGRKMNNGQLRDCDDTVQDETVCKNDERYVLDDGGISDPKKDDIVVQWLLNGECDDDGNGKFESCGMIPIVDKAKLFSAFYESKINFVTDEQNDKNYEMIKKDTPAYDTNDYPDKVAILSSEDYPVKLPTMFKPVLTLFLNHPLWTSTKFEGIPYLEYQILTDKPVSSNESILEVDVVVDGNGFTKTLAKEVPKQLIDFAIQN